MEQGLTENEYIVGIDLGTTHSVISYYHNAKHHAEAIDMSNGFGKIPLASAVQFRKDELSEEWIVGDEAASSYMVYPDSTVLSVKTKMGSGEKITLHHQEFLPEEISAKILSALLDQLTAMNPLAQIVAVVVSVPYDFDDSAKKATLRSCELAGFSKQLICLIEEPKAAALAYNNKYPFKNNEVIMVFDFGGGTLDITVFKVLELMDQQQTLTVLSEGGEARHGGDVLDRLLYEHFIGILEEKGVATDTLSNESKAELSMRARETKERLSGATKVRVPFGMCNPPFVQTITREDFHRISESFIHKTKQLIQRTLQDAYQGSIQASEVNKILLEGGSSQMPWVKELMKEIFVDQNCIYISDRPALDISLGACYYAAMKMGIHQQKDLLTRSSLVNFEVCVPHDIGFEVDVNSRKTFYTMISRGTPYRLAKRSQVFVLQGDSEEEMTTLSVRILERIHKERGINGCSLIGDVMVTGLPKRPSGETQIRVELSIEEES